jgi:hypothetical protein
MIEVAPYLSNSSFLATYSHAVGQTKTLRDYSRYCDEPNIVKKIRMYIKQWIENTATIE